MPGVDLVIIPRRGFDTVAFADLVSDFLAALRRLRVPVTTVEARTS